MALRVLIVDDSSIMRKLIFNTLKESGLLICEVFEAENGAKGLEVLGREEVDFVLLDLNMPVMNGEEMFQRVRNDPKTKSLPVVFVSSDTNKNRIEMLESKGSRFVTKPFDAKYLGQTVKAMIRGARGNG